MFNQRVYSGDGEIHFSGSHLGMTPETVLNKSSHKRNPYTSSRIGKISFSEANLDSECRDIHGPRNVDRMNRSVFQMKPMNMDNILEIPRRETLNKSSKEKFQGLHQGFGREDDMTAMLAYPQLQQFINADKRQSIRKDFEESTGKVLPTIEEMSLSNPLRNHRKDTSTVSQRESQRESHEGFTQQFASDADRIYMNSVKSSIKSILNMIEEVECFRPFDSEWKSLRRQLEKYNWNINLLDSSDKDIAYSLSKGKELNFKTKDAKTYLPMKIMIYVICHELAHVACVSEQGHTEKFSKTMWLIECAAFMCGLLRPSSFPVETLHFSNQSVVSKKIVRDELLIGFNMLLETGYNTDYIESVIDYLKTV